MAFLHSVLKDVCDKQPYKVGKDTLKIEVDRLFGNLCQGHNGFKSVIGQVADGVRGYNREVERSNEAVRNIVTGMQKNMKSLQTQVSGILKDHSDAGTRETLKAAAVETAANSIKGKLAECLQNTEAFNSAFHLDANLAMKTRINDLHNPLSLNVKNAIVRVNGETDTLKALTKKAWDDFRDIYDVVTKTLEELKNNVNDKTGEQVTELVTMWKKMITGIRDRLNQIGELLGGYVAELGKWMNNTEAVIESAQKHVKRIVNKEPGILNQNSIKEIINEINNGFGKAKDHLGTLVAEALQAVKEMDSKLKEDLFKVKNGIKEAIRNLGTKLEKNVRDDLGILRVKIEGPLGKVVTFSDSFDQKFLDTKAALTQVTQNVFNDIESVRNLKSVTEIQAANGITVTAPLLKAIGGNDTFGKVNTYFSNLQSIVMSKVQAAMTAIGDGIRRAGNANTDMMQSAVRAAKTELENLQKVVENSGPELTGLKGKLTAMLGEEFKVDDLELKSKLANGDALQTVINKLNGSSDIISKDDAEKLFTSLGQIAEAVSDHAKTVVEKVMKAVKRQVAKEIKEVARAVNGKVGKCTELLQDGDKVQYGSQKNLSGLQKLVTEFQGEIKGPLTSFQSKFKTDFFKRSGTARAGDDDYDLKTVMSTFKQTYDTNFRTGDFKNVGGTGTENVLDEEIGGDIMASGGGGGNKISSLAQKNFTEYIKQVIPDSLALSADDPNQLDGELPRAIKNIKKYALQKFEEDLKGKDQAADKFEGLLKHIITNLEALTRAFSETGEDLQRYLSDLKDRKISISMASIRRKIGSLQSSTLADVIQDVDTFIDADAETIAASIIENIKTFVTNEINYTTKRITTRARRNYVTSVKALLTAFATKVTQELQPLPAAIDEDLRIGFKGFVKKIETHFIPNVKLIGSLSRSTTTYVEIVEKSPQRSAALSIRLGFEGFLYSLWRQEDVKCDDLKVESLYTPLKTLLDGLEKSQHFDHDFCKNRETFSAAVNLFSPETMEGAPQKLLMPVKYGLQKFLEELKKAYVNQYSGVKFERDLLDGKFLVDHKSQPTATYDLNEYGEKLSKVCLTFLRNLALGFEILRETLIDISNPKTLTSKIHIGNALGDFFAKRGFAVSTGDVKQDGELRNHENMKGEHVHEKLKSADFMERLHDLFNHLSTYNQVCHIRHIPDGKPPRDIRRMLTWMSGLGNNPVYGPLKEYLKTLFPKPNDPNSPPNPNPSLSAYPTDITYQNLTSTLDLIPAYSYKLLTRVLGFGHEGGRYACDIFTNEDDLLYPTSSGQCFDMFIDMLFRLRQQLCFLYTQCHNGPDSSGWSDCYYGRNVAGSAWNCNDLKCPNQQCPQKVDQKGGQIGNQTATQTCDQHPTCGLKSPLQSFLEDGLQGFLPHSITSPGCKLTCSLSNHRGIPCKTPMGFGDIATVASHTKTGIDLKRVLGQYCGQQDSPLTKLCSLLSCLVSRPPQNLGDMFAFYYGFLADWNGGFYKYEKTAYTQDAFNESVNDANFGTSYTALDPSPLFNRTDHAESHSKGDLLSISTCTSDSKETCGLYLRPLASNVYTIFSSKYKSNYLSWIVYITETFNDLLQKLYDDCNSKCGKMQNKCRGVICIRDCPTAIPSDKSRNHTSECGSIVKCPDTYPTLCKYGFTFGSAYDLSGRGRHPHQRRTCNNFCEALKKVLSNKESDGAPLAKLIFRTILPDIVSPLVAVAPVPAAHRRRPPRRPEDTLPPEITRKPPHRRTVPPRRRTRQGTRQRQVLLTVIVPSRVICVSPTHSLNHPLNHSPTHPPTHSPTHILTHSPNHSFTHPPTQPLNHSLTQPPTHILTNPPTHPSFTGRCRSLPSPSITSSSLDDEIESLKNSAKSTDKSQNDSKIADLKSKLKDHIAKYHSLSESDRTAQLKDIHSRMVSLAELSGKLGQFIGNSDAVTDAIKNGIYSIVDSNEEFKSLRKSSSSTALSPAAVSAELINVDMLREKIEHYEELKKPLESKKSAQNPPLSSEESRLLSSHQSKLDALQKLKSLNESLSSLKRQQDKPCETLLNNLCSGLEKFLGYQETSKGYDGTGIVYSDLDRLCDGVMSFLHGVLESVKDDENVTTYDNNKLNNISTVIALLTKNIGSGRDGLSKSVDQVKGWLGKYEKVVKQKCEDVKTPLGIIKIDMKNSISDTIFEQQKVKSLSTQHNEWKNKVALYLKHAEEAYESKEKLDPELKKKLETPMKLIKQAVEGFQKTCENRDLESLNGTVGSELAKLRKTVEENVRERINDLESSLKSKFRSEIKEPFGQVKSMLGQVNGKLEQWIEEAKLVVTKAIGHCDLILERVKLRGPGGVIFEKAQLLHDKGKTLVDAYKVAHERVSDLRKKVQESIAELETAMKRDLGRLQLQIINNMKAHVKLILTNVKTDVNKILNGEKPQELKGLKGIGNGVVDYATEFTGKGRFRNKVHQWIADILEDNKMVKGTLDKWIKENEKKLNSGYQNAKDDGDQRAQFNTKIAELFRDALNGEVIDSVNFEDDKENNIKGNLDKVKEGIEEFVQMLGSQLNPDILDGDDGDGGNDSVVTKIVQVITERGNEAQGVFKERPEDNGNKLTSAVILVLTALQSKASQAAEELETFALDARVGTNTESNQTSIAEELDKAHKTANDLHEELGKVTQPGGSTATGKFADGIEKQISAEINRHIPASGEIVVMTQYSKKKGKGTDHKYYELLSKDIPEAMSAFTTGTHGGPIPSGDVQAEIDHIQRILNSITKELQAITKLVKNGTDSDKGTRTLLKELQEGINTTALYNADMGLTQVKENLKAIIGTEGKDDEKLTTLVGIIKKADQFHNEIGTEATEAIKDIRDLLQTEVKRVTVEIRNKAQEFYARTKRTELGILQAIILEQHGTISDVIEKDKTTGVKGLLRIIKGDMEGQGASDEKSNLLDDVKSAGTQTKDHGDKLIDISNKSQAYFEHIYRYVHYDMFQNFEPQSELAGQYSETIKSIHSALTTLLSHLREQKHFTHQVPGMLAELKTSVQALHSTNFGNPAYPVLDAFPKSLVRFVEQLERGYVNRYEGGDKITWEKKGTTATVYTTHVSYDTELTEESQKGAKVFLSIMDIISDAFSKMDYKCNGDWSSKKLCEKVNGDENPLGAFLKRCGFEVAKNEASKDGELHHESVWNGNKIHTDCLKAVQDATNNEHLKACASKKADINVLNILSCLMTHLNQYNQVGHIATFAATRTPCSIFDMLCWLSGLPHNAVFEKFTAHCSSYDTKGDTDLRKRLLDAVAYSFPNIGKYSHNMLTTIVGTGNADTMYASDLANNSLKFKYPSSGEGCLSTLLDILRRLLPVCRFLYKQCGVRPSHFGWRDCQYGKNIPTAKWPCTDHPTGQANTEPKDQSTCQPTCQANSKPNCQPTSPLMSYLNDCLPGHLPHQLMSVGCMSVCSTCPSTSRNGIPCLTPLGFRAFSGSTKTGRDLCEIIKKFFTNVNLSSLFCLSPKPPVTLPEHFGFALSLVGQWADTSRYGVDRLQTAIESTIKDKSIALYDPPTELMNALTNAYGHGIEGHDECDDTHVTSLTSSGTCNSKNTHSAPYLSPLCSDAYKYLANKNAGLYLSWIAYLPWVFQQYLECLLDAFKNIFCHEWGCHVCFYNDKCKKGKHGESEHPCQCSSIVKCKGVAPTLYSYGFTFNDVLSLNASKFATKCSDFQEQLSKVTKSNYFTELFKQCDELLWKIREPFSQTLLALWSLSLLYLLHIAVVRLDVLRIRSHLRSPSSHRIAAQSLLTAARVGKIANVKYFSP
ncbi:hypothetical protein, conserved [Babesia ovata]|uniref:C3H1-type domain-containing protein n=1 Tax=Babesia ovata TaxID=189622 RepID=A0A2H6KJ61_9APIC|nr:uncharacterized protein BOVATA_045250 [Babesia ovata]GBE63032.1 hypothetical protein, conserved [Babesia ovata]